MKLDKKSEKNICFIFEGLYKNIGDITVPHGESAKKTVLNCMNV